MNDNMIQCTGVSKSYRRGSITVTPLEKLDLSVRRGEFLALMGPSGSGKTTLLNLLSGIDSPTEGSLVIAGNELARFSRRELTKWRSQHVGYIFQLYHLVPVLSAFENVELPLLYRGDAAAARRVAALKALQSVGLGGWEHHTPAELSGGQQQRVAIARAIAKRPEVLLCDEPTGALDVTTGITVLEAVERINRELGTLTVIITHNAVMAEMADTVLHLSDGKIVSSHRNEARLAAAKLKW